MCLKNVFKIFTLIVYFAIITIIFYFAANSAEDSSKQSNQVTDVVIDIVDSVNPNESLKDKFDIEDIRHFVRKAIGHYGLFLLLGLIGMILYYLWINKLLIRQIIGISSGFLVGMISEIIQNFAEGRGPSFDDMLLDFGGYITGYILIGLIFFAIYKIKNRKKLGANYE